MMNVGVAQMMVGLIESGRISPSEETEADHGSMTTGRKTRLHRFFAPLRVALETFQQGRLLRREVARLDALSPHLLDDIGLGQSFGLEAELEDAALNAKQSTPASIATTVNAPVETVAPTASKPIIIPNPPRFDRPAEGIFAAADELRDGIGRVHLTIAPATNRPHSRA
ncbi:DUF1127 domain-containing protein [Tabrizicola sp. BL-A-41-H6]|uniref:DUF1127 domain-containing protein n=1 Tax=Tabrizicola sp. BL-A-41-H6 TaxID=3421107 RepID=UPI003D66DEEE